MAEEQKWQEQGSHTLCANNCGFFGSPTTLNMCSKCYKDHCLKERQMKDAQLAVEKTLTQAKSSVDSPSSTSSSSSCTGIKFHNTRVESKEAAVRKVSAPETAVQAENRCATCRRRVGLTGFKCRCGVTFCGIHRYPEQHGCAFDYKALGREAIAKANPVVKAEKLEKI